jgi:hypothetical protein
MSNIHWQLNASTLVFLVNALAFSKKLGVSNLVCFDLHHRLLFCFTESRHEENFSKTNVYCMYSYSDLTDQKETSLAELGTCCDGHRVRITVQISNHEVARHIFKGRAEVSRRQFSLLYSTYFQQTEHAAQYLTLHETELVPT